MFFAQNEKSILAKCEKLFFAKNKKWFLAKNGKWFFAKNQKLILAKTKKCFCAKNKIRFVATTRNNNSNKSQVERKTVTNQTNENTFTVKTRLSRTSSQQTSSERCNNTGFHRILPERKHHFKNCCKRLPVVGQNNQKLLQNHIKLSWETSSKDSHFTVELFPHCFRQQAYSTPSDR